MRETETRFSRKIAREMSVLEHVAAMLFAKLILPIIKKTVTRNESWIFGTDSKKLKKASVK